MDLFWKYLRATRDRFALLLIIQTAMFALGVLIVLIVNASIGKGEDYGTVGSLLALAGVVLAGLLYGMANANQYHLAVSMGLTRRAFMQAEPVLTVLGSLLGLAAAWLLNLLERALYRRLYPAAVCELDINGFFRWKWVLPAVAGVALLGFCAGALLLRFGQKAWYFIWLPLCLGPNLCSGALTAAKSGSSSLLAMLGRGLLWLAGCLPAAAWAGLGLVLCLLLTAFSVCCYRRAEVRL